ncbi:kinase-like domain-containing protein [Irpex rosettiformis]|uniref:Kinase-like domain-containing protein n=1 Tax=Irpex rosettiformis TaxID=378272 RepID=A0ACB8TQP5_9APHY|nr:kinase-like domain-containing protein [Irpex rosettiformis]
MDEYSRGHFPNGPRCLESYLRTYGRLSLENTKYVFYQLADAVFHLHSNGISHCDIKPSNILIDADLKVWLIDFIERCACLRGAYTANRVSSTPTQDISVELPYTPLRISTKSFLSSPHQQTSGR